MPLATEKSRLTISLGVFALWLVITLGGAKLLAPANQPLSELVTKTISWNLVAAAALLIAAIVFFNWRDLKFVRPQPWNILPIIWFPLIYLMLFAAIALLSGPMNTSILPFVAVNTAIVGFSEEAMFRGILFQAFRKRFKLWHAIVMTTLLFGSVHVLNVFTTGNLLEGAVQATAAAMSGLVFIAMLIRTGSIWVPIIYHALWDFGTFTLGSIESATSGAGQPAVWLTIVLPIALVLPNFLYAIYLLRRTTNETLLTTD